jgi:TonB family protein
MEQANRFLVRAMLVLVVSLCIVSPAWPNADKHRKNAAKSLAKEIELAQFHKVYVLDFLDPSGIRTEKGCFFASTFSTNLAKDAHSFEVVNRIQAQRQLNELHISPQDLQRPEMLSKSAQALGADAVLVGTATISPTEANLLLSLRDAASGKEAHSLDYHEKLERVFESSFPATQGNGDLVYYFPGLDGVSQVKCNYCPNPDYTDEARQNGIEGTVRFSVVVSEKGIISGARVETNPNDSMTKQAVNILEKWRLEPSHDLEGNAVPVRVGLEITFRLLP